MLGLLDSRTVQWIPVLLFLGILTGCAGKKEEKRAASSSKHETSPAENQGTNPSEDVGPADPSTRVEQPMAAKMEPEESKDHHVVQVFYATDRQPHNATDPPEPASFYKFPLLFSGFCFVFIWAAFRRKRKVGFGILAVVAAGFALKSLQTGMLESQRLTRALANDDRVYGADRHEVSGIPILEMGICEVSVPPDHRVGRVESPSILRLEFHEDPDKHVVVERTMQKTDGDFMEELKSCLSESDAKQALVFIHGYNVSFDSAVKRTAQMAHDLEFDGAPICYSWPSQGQLAKYTYDEDSIAWTVPQLETFLKRVVDQSGAETVHLVAHSMGNRALLEVLERIYLQNKDDHYTFGQIIMAAPDVNASSFRNRYAPVLNEMSERATLYASSNDRALLASTKIHGHTRAGLSGENLLALVGVETVDASPIDTSLIGHSYYGDNPALIRDLRALIQANVPPRGRDWLEELLQSPDVYFWRFRDRPPTLHAVGDRVDRY